MKSKAHTLPFALLLCCLLGCFAGTLEAAWSLWLHGGIDPAWPVLICGVFLYQPICLGGCVFFWLLCHLLKRGDENPSPWREMSGVILLLLALYASGILATGVFLGYGDGRTLAASIALLASGFLLFLVMTLFAPRAVYWKILIAFLLILLPITEFSYVFVDAREKGLFQKQESVDHETNLRGPHIIVFLIDALRWDHLSLYGYEAENSSHIETLARDSVVFETCIAQAPSTKPSVASLFTSRYPESHHANDLESVLPYNLLTLAEILDGYGYETVCFSGNPFVSPQFGLTQGFKSFFGYESEVVDRLLLGKISARVTSVRRVSFLNKVGKVLRRWPLFLSSLVGFKRRSGEFSAGEIVEEFQKWFATAPASRPHFLYIHLLEPHQPYIPPPEYRDQFGAGEDARTIPPDPGPWVLAPFDVSPSLSLGDLESMVALYDGEIAYADWAVGEMIRLMKERGWYEDSLLFLTSDHGQEFHDHGNWQHGRSLFEEVLRVPLLVKLPGNQDAGSRRRDVARLVDIAPTVLDMAGGQSPEWFEGRSLFSEDAEDEEVFAYSSVTKRSGRSISLRTGRHKYIWAQRGEDISELFFDLEDDPGEMESLTDELENEVDNFRRLTEDISRQSQPEGEEGREGVISPETREKLKVLGYVE